MEISKTKIASTVNKYSVDVLKAPDVLYYQDDTIDPNGKIIRFGFESESKGYNRLNLYISCSGFKCICFYDGKYIYKNHRKMPKSLMYIFSLCKIDSSRNYNKSISYWRASNLFKKDSAEDPNIQILKDIVSK